MTRYFCEYRIKLSCPVIKLPNNRENFVRLFECKIDEITNIMKAHDVSFFLSFCPSTKFPINKIMSMPLDKRNNIDLFEPSPMNQVCSKSKNDPVFSIFCTVVYLTIQLRWPIILDGFKELKNGIKENGYRKIWSSCPMRKFKIKMSNST